VRFLPKRALLLPAWRYELKPRSDLELTIGPIVRMVCIALQPCAALPALGYLCTRRVDLERSTLAK
jgi:hypothetical protein